LLVLMLLPASLLPLSSLLESLLVSDPDDVDGLPAGVVPPPTAAPGPASAGASPEGSRLVAGGVEVGIWAGGAGGWTALPLFLPPFLDGLGLDFGRAFGFGFAAGFTAGEEERDGLAVGAVIPEPEPLEAELEVVGDAVSARVWTAAEAVVGRASVWGAATATGTEAAVTAGAAAVL
jgi:hypothetical protein